MSEPRTFEQFMQAVRDSCEAYAQKKGYTVEDVNGSNQLLDITRALGINNQHGIAEIIYKCVEFLKEPREVLLVKIAGWSYILWKAFTE